MRAEEREREPVSVLDAYFDHLYADSDDPWGIETRWYEQRKRALTLASLPEARFRSAFEPGCSTGVLTRALAERCDRLLATDIAGRPLHLARKRLSGCSQVRVERMAVPYEWPEGERFDLIVLSELGYYLDRDAVVRLMKLTAESLDPGGTVVACHWRHPVEGYPLRGDEVHDVLAAARGLARLARHEEDDFLLDVMTPAPATSVARRTGVVG
ncbi:MAG: class I SAM-dependent DNA methyltransferase [Streptosporangiales bacterium]